MQRVQIFEARLADAAPSSVSRRSRRDPPSPARGEGVNRWQYTLVSVTVVSVTVHSITESLPSAGETDLGLAPSQERGRARNGAKSPI